jgi:hypothetical protein
MEAERLEQMAAMLKALADATRLRILGALAERPHTGKDLSERLGLTPPTISHHLRKLEEVELIRTVPDAQRQWHQLNTEALRVANRTTAGASSDTNKDAAEDDESRFRAKVLRDFFDGDQLKQIPAQRKKRVVVLQYLLQRFAPDKVYSERDVNDALRVAHEDVATLRRELVDYGFMHRERGLYRVATQPPGRSVQVTQEILGDEHEWLRQLVSAATEHTLRPAASNLPPEA